MPKLEIVYLIHTIGHAEENDRKRWVESNKQGIRNTQFLPDISNSCHELFFKLIFYGAIKPISMKDGCPTQLRSRFLSLDMFAIYKPIQYEL